MPGIFLREFTISTRRVPFAACLVAHLALVSAFLLIWPNGAPLLPGSIYEQARWIDAAVLACVLPWASVRLAATSDAGTRVRLAVFSGVKLPALAIGSLMAMAAVLSLITVAGAPLLLRALEMSAESWTRLARDEAALVAFACAVASLGAAAAVCSHRLFRWLLAAMLTLVLAGTTGRIVHSSLGAAFVFAGVGTIVTLLLAQRAAVSPRYLVEQHE